MEKILFGINKNSDKKIENKILAAYREKTGKEFDFHSEYYLKGILKSLEEDKYSILMIVEDLEPQNPVNIGYIDEITDRFPYLNIIIVINDEHRETDFPKKLFSQGIYNVIFASDITLEELVNLIQTKRTKREAKIYLGIATEDINETVNYTQEVDEDELINIVIALNNSEAEGLETLYNTYIEISKQYTSKQIIHILTVISERIIEKLATSSNPTIQKDIIEYNKRKTQYMSSIREDLDNADEEKQSKSFPLIFKKGNENKTQKSKDVQTIVKVEQVLYIPDDYTKVIAIVSDNNKGSTTITDLIATYLSTNRVSVSVIDLTKDKGLLYLKNITINDEEDGPLIELNNDVVNPYEINENYNLFTDKEDVFLKNLKAIDIIKQNSKIVLLDLDLDAPEDIYKLADEVYIVLESSLTNLKNISNYIQNAIEETIHTSKLRLIINKFIPGQATKEEIITTLNSKNINIEDNIYFMNYCPDIYKSYIEKKSTFNLTEEISKQIQLICENIYPINLTGSKKKFSIKNSLLNLKKTKPKRKHKSHKKLATNPNIQIEEEKKIKFKPKLAKKSQENKKEYSTEHPLISSLKLIGAFLKYPFEFAFKVTRSTFSFLDSLLEHIKWLLMSIILTIAINAIAKHYFDVGIPFLDETIEKSKVLITNIIDKRNL